MSVLSRAALEGSPLADLHAIASELGIDGFRRLRKPDLIDQILDRSGGDAEPAVNGSAAPEAETTDVDTDTEAVTDADDTEAAPAEARPARTRSRGGRSRSRDADANTDAAAEPAEKRPRRGADRERAAGNGREPRNGRDAREGEEERTIEGIVEILGNGSGFIRLAHPAASDDDVYVSAAQVRRCELVSGDRVGGPVRRPRRSERYPSLVRVETINGTSADEVSDGTPYDELPAAWPATPWAFKAKDATLKQIADLAPIGRGSRVTVIGGPGSGRSATLRLLAIELAAEEGVELSIVLSGSRPEETADWAAADLTPAAVATIAASPDAQGQAVERAVEAARHVTARGGHAVVVIDALDNVAAGAARRALAAARNVPDAGSLTIIAGAREPVGGETTIITLDTAAGTAARRPVLDPSASGTLRTELLVGARKATTIAKNRTKAADAA